MNYSVGDTVVCIDATPVHGGGGGTLLTTGENYTVLAIMFAECCGAALTDVGLPKPKEWLGVRCHKCGRPRFVVDGFRASWRFIKLDGVKQEHTEEATA